MLAMVAAHAGSARASDARSLEKVLRVEPGATCLTAAELAVEVERSLDGANLGEGYAVFVEGSASDPRSARVRVVRHEGTVAERVFAPGPERCSHLHAAIGLSIALAIKAGQDDEGEHEVGRPWSFAGSGLWTVRLLPQVAPGAELLVRRALGEHLSLRAGALAALSFDAPFERRDGSFDATLIAARADACVRTELASVLHAGACAGVLFGVLYAAGEQVASPAHAAAPWVALAGGAGLELGLSARWALGLGLSATLLLHEVEVGLEDAQGARVESRALPRLGFALGIGPVYYF